MKSHANIQINIKQIDGIEDIAEWAEITMKSNGSGYPENR